MDLAATKMSTRAIGAALGVHHSTVADDLAKAGVGKPTPESNVPATHNVTKGRDGKTSAQVANFRHLQAQG